MGSDGALLVQQQHFVPLCAGEHGRQQHAPCLCVLMYSCFSQTILKSLHKVAFDYL